MGVGGQRHASAADIYATRINIRGPIEITFVEMILVLDQYIQGTHKTMVQREFRARFKKDAPRKNSISRWYRQFVETGCWCKGQSPGRPRVKECVRRFSEVPASQWLKEAGNWACQK
jgi:hypothetical protein